MTSRGCTTCTAAQVPGGGEHTLRLAERGTTGEAANLFVECSCGKRRPMAPAFGREAVEARCPAAGAGTRTWASFEECGCETRTLGLGATNGWFAMQVRAFSLPLAETEVDQRVAENWAQLSLLLPLPAAARPRRCCPAWPAGRTSSPTAPTPSGRRSGAGPSEAGPRRTTRPTTST